MSVVEIGENDIIFYYIAEVSISRRRVDFVRSSDDVNSAAFTKKWRC